MNREPDLNLNELHETLLAYLDRELDPAEQRSVEERLASEPAVRDELHRLERAWDALDALPRATVDETFTRSTMEMVTLAAAAEVEAESVELPRRMRRQWLASFSGLLAASLLGFIATAWILPDRNESLLRDLTVIENVDVYTQVGDLEFLRELQKSQLFDESRT